MIQRSARIAFEVVIGVLAGLAVLGGIAIWRLSAGPVRLDFLTPYLESALEGRESSIVVEIGETLITWEGWARNVDLMARQTRVSDAGGKILAVLPDISLELSFNALMAGTIAPTAIEVIRPRVALTRELDGSIAFGGVQKIESEAESAAEGDLSSVVPLLLDEMLSETAAGSPLTYLKELRIRDGQLSIQDKRLGLNWEVPKVDLEVRRDPAGLAGEIELEAGVNNDAAAFELAFIYGKANAEVDLAANFSDFRPLTLAAVSPQLDLLTGFDLPLSGSATATVGLDGVVDALSIEIDGGKGTLAVPERIPDPRPVQDFYLKADFNGDEGRLQVEQLRLKFGEDQSPGPEIKLAGSVTGIGGDMTLEAEAHLQNFKIDELGLYWPLGLGPAAREWIVENIRAGTADEATLRMTAEIPGGDLEALDLKTLGGEIRYSNIAVHYLRPVPPVTGISGTAVYDKKSMTLSVAGGQSGDLLVSPSEVKITDLDTDREKIAIALKATGSLRSTLELLNHERLALIEKLGVKPSDVGGEILSAEVGFKFPLLQDLTFDDIEVTAQAELDKVALKNAALGQDVTEGRLQLTLDQDGMRSVGPVKLGGVPIAIEWSESFTSEAEEQSRYIVDVARWDDDGRAAIGIDFGERLSGPVSASVVAVQANDGNTTIAIAANLQETSMELPNLRWSKPKGAPGEARVTLRVVDGSLSELTALDLNSGTLRVRGKGRFDASGKDLISGQLSEVVFDATALRDVDFSVMDGGYDIKIGGGVLDLGMLLAKDEGAEETDSEEPETPLKIAAPALDAIYFAPGRYLEKVTLGLDRKTTGWNAIQLRGEVPRSLWTRDAAQAAEAGEEPTDSDEKPIVKSFAFNYRPGQNGQHKLDITASDMGAVLRTLDVMDTIEGGELEVTGLQEPGEPIVAEIEATDFTAIDAPLLARLLIVASLTGIFEGLTSSGIDFDRLTGEFKFKDGQFRTENLRAFGASLGLTTKGQIDVNRSRIDLKGTIVPAYLLNRILGTIPVIGTLLTGGEGQGLVAFTYKMEGDLKEPEVSVNPLSALAPGFLRGIFSGDGTSEETTFPDGENR